MLILRGLVRGRQDIVPLYLTDYRQAAYIVGCITGGNYPGVDKLLVLLLGERGLVSAFIAHCAFILKMYLYILFQDCGGLCRNIPGEIAYIFIIAHSRCNCKSFFLGLWILVQLII